MEKHPVKLYVYDISRGFARQMSPVLLGLFVRIDYMMAKHPKEVSAFNLGGKRIDGIWHTGVVCYGREFFYGGGGIESCLPGGTILGSPDEIIDLGETEISQDIFMEYLGGIGCQNFRPESYHLFEHNCNTFSSEASIFLTGKRIPQHIQDLPSEVLNTSFGRMIKPLVDSMSVRPAGGTSLSDLAASSRQSEGPEVIFEPRESAAIAHASRRDHVDGCASAVLRKPVIFNQDNVSSTITRLFECLHEENFSDQSLKILGELKQLCETKDLDEVQEKHIQVIGTDFQNIVKPLLLVNPLTPDKFSKVTNRLDQVIEKYFSKTEHPVLLLSLQLLQVLVLCDRLWVRSQGIKEIVQKLCGNYSGIKQNSCQVDAVKMFCCAVSHKPGHSTMCTGDSIPLSSVVVNSLLSKDDDLLTLGSALASNIARFQIDEDAALECSTAIIEVLRRTVSPETAHNCLYALRRFVEYSPEVGGLASAMGVNLDKFKGNSKEIDELCNDLQRLVA